MMCLVVILLLNLLIAMMGDTYAKIAEIKNEWMRQVNIQELGRKQDTEFGNGKNCCRLCEAVTFLDFQCLQLLFSHAHKLVGWEGCTFKKEKKTKSIPGHLKCLRIRAHFCFLFSEAESIE
jgi:hypothetical protein